MKVTNTRTHTMIGFANPYLICDTCKVSVRYWHNPDRCGCDNEYFNYLCEHSAGVTSKCPTWDIVDGCSCEDQENHDKFE